MVNAFPCTHDTDVAVRASCECASWASSERAPRTRRDSTLCGQLALCRLNKLRKNLRLRSKGTCRTRSKQCSLPALQLTGGNREPVTSTQRCKFLLLLVMKKVLFLESMRLVETAYPSSAEMGTLLFHTSFGRWFGFELTARR